jgi:ABC-type thiamine transport system substrate-binding protein
VDLSLGDHQTHKSGACVTTFRLYNAGPSVKPNFEAKATIQVAFVLWRASQSHSSRVLRNLQLPHALADLLGSEAADSVETERKNHSVLFSQTHVETGKLERRGTAVPRMPECDC